MIEFHLESTGERVLMPLHMILCLMPDHHQLRTVESGWTLTVAEPDWPAVEQAFTEMYRERT